MSKPVIDYDEYRLNAVENRHPDGFWFDMNQFENLIDAWTPKEDILTILQTSPNELDNFCKICYGENFDRVYEILHAISTMGFRKSVTFLAKSGNSSALILAAKNFAGMQDDNQSSNVNITFKNDLT